MLFGPTVVCSIRRLSVNRKSVIFNELSGYVGGPKRPPATRLFTGAS